MFPHLQETSMNKTIQKKVDLNVILTVFIGVQFGHQGWAKRKVAYEGVLQTYLVL